MVPIMVNAEPVLSNNGVARRHTYNRGPMMNRLYKTELCWRIQNPGGCPYGDKCNYAHSKEEIRSRNFNPRYKTKPCLNFSLRGVCQYGDQCQYIHKRENDDNSDEKVKEKESVPSDCKTKEKISSGGENKENVQPKHQEEISSEENKKSLGGAEEDKKSSGKGEAGENPSTEKSDNAIVVVAKNCYGSSASSVTNPTDIVVTISNSNPSVDADLVNAEKSQEESSPNLQNDGANSQLVSENSEQTKGAEDENKFAQENPPNSVDKKRPFGRGNTRLFPNSFSQRILLPPAGLPMMASADGIHQQNVVNQQQFHQNQVSLVYDDVAGFIDGAGVIMPPTFQPPVPPYNNGTIFVGYGGLGEQVYYHHPANIDPYFLPQPTPIVGANTFCMPPMMPMPTYPMPFPQNISTSIGASPMPAQVQTSIAVAAPPPIDTTGQQHIHSQQQQQQVSTDSTTYTGTGSMVSVPGQPLMSPTIPMRPTVAGSYMLVPQNPNPLGQFNQQPGVLAYFQAFPPPPIPRSQTSGVVPHSLASASAQHQQQQVSGGIYQPQQQSGPVMLTESGYQMQAAPMTSSDGGNAITTIASHHQPPLPTSAAMVPLDPHPTLSNAALISPVLLQQHQQNAYNQHPFMYMQYPQQPHGFGYPNNQPLLQQFQQPAANMPLSVEHQLQNNN